MAASRGNLRIGWGKKNRYILELSVRKYNWVFINPSHPNIILHILYTLLYTFPKVLTRRICIVIKNFFSCDHLLYSHDVNKWSAVILQGEIRCWSLLGLIGLSALLASSFKNLEIIHLLLERSRMTLNFFFNLTTEQSHNFVPGELVHKPALESVPSWKNQHRFLLLISGILKDHNSNQKSKLSFSWSNNFRGVSHY